MDPLCRVEWGEGGGGTWLMVNSGGEIEQFRHSYRNMGVKLKAGKNVLQSAWLEGGQFGDASDSCMEGEEPFQMELLVIR